MADFSASTLLEIQLKADRVWRDNMTDARFVAEVETLRAIKENQTAQVQTIADSARVAPVSVHWIDTSPIVAGATVENCTLDGPLLGSLKQTYDIVTALKSDFAIDEQDLEETSFTQEQVVAEGILKASKALDEELNALFLAKLKTFSGVNEYLSGYTFATGTTTIPAADWNINLFTYFAHAARMNRMRDSYMITNDELYRIWLNAGLDANNADGSGNAARARLLKTYFDLFGFTEAALTEDAFLINRGSVAMASRTKNPDIPRVITGNVNQTRYTVESKNIPGLKYDAFYTTACRVVNGVDRIVHIWRLQVNADLLLNPVSIADRKGVLSFSKGA